MGNWNWHKNWKLLAAGLSFLAVLGTPLCGLTEASAQKRIVPDPDGTSVRTVKPLQAAQISERISLPSSSDAEADGDYETENESFQEETGELQAESASNALALAPLFAGPAQDFWSGWNGDLSFLDGSRGDGTEEKPYQISTREHLMGLSILTAGGMEIREGEDLSR